MSTGGWVLHPGWGFGDELKDELPALDATFPAAHGHTIAPIPPGRTVIPRFRALPFGRELEDEVAAAGSRLINTYQQHRFAANLAEWYPVFADITPDTWSRVEDIPAHENGPFIVKGETNSRRNLWSTHCYAADRSRLGSVIANLHGDGLISYQHLFIRRFVPLHTYGADVVGMPVSDEYRVFYLDGIELARGFYWVNHLDLVEGADAAPNPEAIPGDLIEIAGERLKGRIRFAALDFARTADDQWTLIELNDGSMSGCCGVDSWTLYSALAERL